MTLAPETLYPNTSSQRPERQGVSRKTVIGEAKAQVPVIDLADRLAAGQGGRWRKVGAEWIRNCVLDDHEDQTPSFTVNPDKNVWWCHGCLRGGDVVELARHAWGYSKAEAPMAAADLLREFGHEIPPRPESWFRKQERQRPVREKIEEAKVRHVQRRVFRIFARMLAEIEDQGERRKEAKHLWDASEEIAVLMLAGRRAS